MQISYKDIGSTWNQIIDQPINNKKKNSTTFNITWKKATYCLVRLRRKL